MRLSVSHLEPWPGSWTWTWPISFELVEVWIYHRPIFGWARHGRLAALSVGWIRICFDFAFWRGEDWGEIP